MTTNATPSKSSVEEHSIGDDVMSDVRTLELYDKVFSIDLLRDQIMNRAMYDGSQFSVKHVMSLRQVNHQWSDYITKHMLKSGNSLFKIKLGTTSSIDNGVDVLKFIKFLDSYTLTPNLLEKFPPFEIEVTISQRQFRETLAALKKCFRLSGSALVKLTLNFKIKPTMADSDKALLLEVFQDLSLPNLRDLTLYISNDMLLYGPGIQQLYMEREVTAVLQLSLSACKKLTRFGVKTNTYVSPPLPSDLKNIVLPRTVETLQLPKGMSEEDLEYFIENNEFPNLINLHVDFDPTMEDFVYKMTQKLSHTLKTLKINGPDISIYSSVPVRLDVMKSLPSIHIKGGDSEWVEHYVVDKMGYHEIKCIEIYQVEQTKSFETARFKFVEELDIKLEKVVWPENFTSFLLKSVPESFPRITKLYVSTELKRNTRAGLECILENMQELQVLSIETTTNSSELGHQHYWSSLLIGKSVHIVDYWELAADSLVKRRLESNILSGIINMRGLREFKLKCASRFNRYTMSDVVFRFAFFKMPKLQKLELFGLKPSPRMTRMWRVEGRKITVGMAPYKE